jgi:hypothetical protein
MDMSEPERPRDYPASLSLDLGDGALRSVRIVGNEVIVVTDCGVRGYRGASREVK